MRDTLGCGMPSRLAMADWLSPDRFLASAIARLMVRSAFTRILSSMSLTVSKVCFAVDSDNCRVESCSLFIAVNYITRDMPRSKMQALHGYITQRLYSQKLTIANSAIAL